MKIFLACSYSAKINYENGEVFPEFREWLEGVLATIESTGVTAFNALRQDGYKVNDIDPADAFFLDKNNIDDSDVILALLDPEISAGVQTEIGYGIAKGKKVILAHYADDHVVWFNAAMIKAGVVEELILPLTAEKLSAHLGETAPALAQ